MRRIVGPHTSDRLVGKLIVVAVLAFVALAASPARGETLTLQEGVSGYGGCTESHIQADG